MSTPFPVGGRRIVEQMAARFPDLFVNDDDKQRQLTTKIGEQFAFTFGPKWGNKKRAGLSDDFRSKDSIAVWEPDGTISVWDMFSSGMAILVNDGDQAAPGTHAHLPPSEATFMACVPVNHLGGNPLPGEVPDPPDSGETLPNSGTVDLSPVMAELAVLKGLIAQLQHQKFPNYKGAVFGYGITLKPEGQ